jgi:hypothetical protein
MLLLTPILLAPLLARARLATPNLESFGHRRFGARPGQTHQHASDGCGEQHQQAVGAGEEARRSGGSDHQPLPVSKRGLRH